MTETPLLAVEGLVKEFSTKNGVVKAVDDVTFQVNKGETVAVVGESGCGKSTLAMTVLGLETATAGEIVVEGDRLGDVSRVVADRLGRDVGIVFQNPLSALNPKMKVAAIVGEPLKTALGLRGKDLHERVALLLEEVGLRPEHMRRYPHEFSGGQCQRICIARALALKPKLLILDEPTAALDVSVQAQILKLLNELQRELGVSYLFITHDLGTVDYIADRVLVMYLGKIVENGPVAQVFSAPAHPYTRALLDWCRRWTRPSAARSKSSVARYRARSTGRPAVPLHRAAPARKVAAAKKFPCQRLAMEFARWRASIP